MKEFTKLSKISTTSPEPKPWTPRSKRGTPILIFTKSGKLIKKDSCEEASKLLRSDSQRNYLQNKLHFAKRTENKVAVHFESSEIGECIVIRERDYKKFKKTKEYLDYDKRTK